MKIVQAVPIVNSSTPHRLEMLVLDGAGLTLHDGRVIKFKDIAAQDESGQYIFPPQNSTGHKLPYIERARNPEGSSFKWENLNLITPGDIMVRYRTWSDKNFVFTIRDLLRFLCIYENKTFRDAWLGAPYQREFDVCCRDCVHCEPHNNHVSTAICNNGSKSGKFKAGSDVCRFFTEELLKNGVPPQ